MRIALLTLAARRHRRPSPGRRAPADERDFCAQRPGKATPPCVLDAGHLQIETGLVDAVFQHGGGVHDDTYALGATRASAGR